MKLSREVVELFRGTNYGIVVTRRADGTPHSTPVWIDTDGEDVMFNTHTRRAKFRHLRRNPWVAVTVLRHDDPQRVHATVYGHVRDFDFEHARGHLDKMARKYLAQDYPSSWLAADEERVVIVIEPDRVDYFERESIPDAPPRSDDDSARSSSAANGGVAASTPTRASSRPATGRDQPAPSTAGPTAIADAFIPED